MNACNKFSVFIDCAGYFIDALETIAYNFSIITFDALKSNSFFAQRIFLMFGHIGLQAAVRFKNAIFFGRDF